MATFRLLRVAAVVTLAAYLRLPSFGATGVLRVDETKIKFGLGERPVVEFPIVNVSAQPLPGTFRLELLDTHDRVASTVTGTFLGNPGTNVEKVPWPLGSLVRVSALRFGWHRLRYAFAPRPESGVQPAQGIVQLSRVLAGLFQVRVAAASMAKPGNRFPVRVRVDDPITGKPRRGADVELTLTLDDDQETTLKHALHTDLAGYAVYTFDLPKETKAEEGTVTALVSRGALSDEAEVNFQMRAKNKITLTTDKPLYQPGQVAHFRVLALGPDRRALADKDIVIAIEDEDGNEQFHETARTSRFGVASADWTTPEKLRLGDYRASAGLKDSEDDYDYESQSTATLRVSRYELPTFTVKAEPDRGYYLPGQAAKVEISADYLFGKPVQKATVRLVRQQSRHWDFKKQKWATEESDPIEGTFDQQGKFQASVNLEDRFDGFDPQDFSHYEELSLAAYVTDLSTKRTEQRRFRIRLSRQPIQLYVIGGALWSPAKESATLYVTSSYADGKPASVNGTLYFAEPNDKGEFEKAPWQAGRSKILSFHTNRFGVGKITLPRFRDRFLVKPHNQYRYYGYGQDDETYRNALLLLEAADKEGLRGRTSESWATSATVRYLRVKTPQALYHPGEALPVSIESNSPVGQVVVSVSTPAGLVSSKVVQLVRGQADLSFDYNDRLRGDVEIAAFSLTGADVGNRALSGTAHVIYPSPQDLKVSLKMPRTTYRPGETASADLRVRSPHGGPVESALGILVFDRAVAERVRADEEFGRSYGFSIYDYLEDNIGKIAEVSARDLLGLDATQPFSADLQLLAEALLYSAQGNWWSGNVQLAGGEDYVRDAGQVYSSLIDRSLESVRRALEDAFRQEGRYPKNDAQLNAALGAKGIDLTKMLDPWGMPYRPQFSINGQYDVLTFKSNGPDKTPDTLDDVESTRMQWQYFREIGQVIDRVVQDYPKQTGRYVRDYATLREAIKAKVIDTDALVDPWGHRYRFAFETSGPYFRVSVISAGPDGIFDSSEAPSWDDVQVWASLVHYFATESDDLERALGEHFASTRQFPKNEEELRPILADAKLYGERLLDPWGRPYHFTFSKQSRYGDRVKISTTYDYAAGKEKRVSDVTPVTQELAFIKVLSYGPDNKPEESFSVAEFSRETSEQASIDVGRKATSSEGPLPAGAGAITGVVRDPSGAVVPNAEISAASQSGRTATTTTDSEGRYAISGIPAGLYEVKIVVPGFQIWNAINIPVQLGSTTKLDAILQIGSVSEAVAVTAEAATMLQTESAEVSSAASKGLQGTAAAQKPLFTPRLRKYFPETLFWKPEVITNGHGQAHIDFVMADNITAWSMSVIASTEAGQVGVAQQELRTFQPFFVEHDPPKVLTQGDQISLPVVLRNYSDREQTVLTELKPEPWFIMRSPAEQKVTVGAGLDAPAVFTFRAESRANPGMQRVTAKNAETGDAVEREVQVHPDGQEISFTSSRILSGDSRTMDLQIPQAAIPGSIDAELRIYPNLIAHVLDAMKGIGRKPAGCAEQITSIAYVSLQALQLLKKAGIETAGPGDPRSQVLAEARKSVQGAYGLLPSLQKANGGFGYWSRSSEDVALTAYVLRFLSAASEFIEVDPGLISRASGFLVSQQTLAGAWTNYDWATRSQKDDPLKTAYVARALATSRTSPSDKDRAAVETSVQKALAYLDDRIGEWRDPYLIGNYAIAAATVRHAAHIANARALLSRLAHQEGATTYWNLEANTTPFYGWGRAGRLETTALAVEALAMFQALNHDSAEEEQKSRGLQYLLTHKDRYCTWYSTQATQNVLEAVIAAMPPGEGAQASSSATILINGTKLASVQLPGRSEITGPRVVELSKGVLQGSNNVEIQSSPETGAMQANVIATYYVPWRQSQAIENENLKTGDTRGLRLKVDLGRHQAKIGEALTCEVEAERIGFRGYGMMIAEIGLPPGAEVDRESLEKARDSGVDGYEVQPDRVVFYLWPRAEGARFEFTFRPRFAMNALSAPSTLYDYYNPEVNATVLPARFTVE